MATTMENVVEVDDKFEDASKAVCDHFSHVLESDKHLFMTALSFKNPIIVETVKDKRVERKATLFDIYLDGFAPQDRQQHNCSACRGFINRFGRLVSINDDGTLKSAMWDPEKAPHGFFKAFEDMKKKVEAGKVVAVFYHDQDMWGHQKTGGSYGFADEPEWHHFYVKPLNEMIHKSLTETAGQRRSASAQNFVTLQRALKEFKVEVVKDAINLLQTDNLYRSEKTMGPAQFLFECHEALEKAVGPNKNVDKSNFPSARNALWRQVAKAAPGFCTPRSGMLGTLLEDLNKGLKLETVKSKFADKMNPLKYQRPVAAPSSGTIAQAEKLVMTLGIERSLERRFARLEEVKKIWVPVVPTLKETTKGGVFSHLKSKEDSSVTRERVVGDPMTISWEKFVRTVLPNAQKIELYLEGAMGFCGVTTAVHDDAPPILQWDREEARNPFSWYFYHGGSAPSQWNLVRYTWVEVTGIMLKPSMWSGLHPNQSRGAVLILKGARDNITDSTGLGLFPEIMKSELHPVRSVIEAYSSKGKLQGADTGSANGLGIAERNGNNRIMVTTAMGQAVYTIDRWD